jgi:hypothetical protein
MKKHYYIIASIILIMILNSCKKKDKYEIFWDWFSKNENEYYNYEKKNQELLFNNLHQKLIEIDSNLVFEFGPTQLNNIREFTISADGLKESFPAVIELVKRAPNLDKWKISSFRQRIPGDEIEIRYDNFKISYDDIYFRYSEESGKIGLELNIRNYEETSEFISATYVLLDGLIGEYDMETKVDWIERKSLDETKIDSLYKLVELRGIIDDLK